MPAPPAALLAALRSGPGRVARHVFVRIDHPSGIVRAWDGVGQMTLDGETYDGVGGLGQIEGLGRSLELQNSGVTLRLNAVPLSTLAADVGAIQNVPARITFAWFDADTNALIASRVEFVGRASHLVTIPTQNASVLELHLRRPMLDWRAAPQVFYNDVDQQRLYPGDTGFGEVEQLIEAAASGWSRIAETSGAYVQNYRDSITGEHVGIAGYGTGGWNVTNGVFRKGAPNAGGLQVLEAVTNTPITTSGQFIVATDNVKCYIDATGDVRTGRGNVVYLQGTSTTANRMRRAGRITVNGAAQSNFIRRVASVVSSTTTFYYFTLNGAPFTVNNSVPNTVAVILVQKGTLLTQGSTPASTLSGFVEETTGAAVTVSGAGDLQVGGVNCSVSTAGVVLTSGGRRIVRSTDATDFLRIWT